MEEKRAASVKIEDKIDSIVKRHADKRGAAIPILQDIQKELGYIPKFALYRISQLTGINSSDLFGIVTFYSQFRLKPIGEVLIQVCHGTACHLAGADEIASALCRAAGITEGETGPDGKITVEKVACLGCCSLAPVITVNGETHGRMTQEKAKELIKEIKKMPRD
ncbi:MAG TPA: NADH-quinone oxidoreductase subunit NuoE [Peptococcaceae bacterium]|nr:MAG: NADH dehydrogenase (Ubiquinone) 24 kDa subunit [Clostridia bacterium 41_269]HBT20444.1 NADH-quinone oxidoreductase subunit NuoE [Peptococcaceae bacterium]